MDVAYKSYYYYYYYHRDPGPALPLGLLLPAQVVDRGLARA